MSRSGIAYPLHVAIIGDRERNGGLMVPRPGKKKVRAIWIRNIARPVPAALYRVPETRECFEAEVDPITEGIFVARWVICDCDVVPFQPRAA